MRWMLLLIIALLLAWSLWPEPEPVPVEDTVLGEPVRQLQEAEAFEGRYLEEAEARKQRMEATLESGDGG